MNWTCMSTSFFHYSHVISSLPLDELSSSPKQHSCLLCFFTSFIFPLSPPSVLLQDFNCWPHGLFSAFPFLLPSSFCVLSEILSLSCWSPLLSTVLQSLPQLLQGHHSLKQSLLITSILLYHVPLLCLFHLPELIGADQCPNLIYEKTNNEDFCAWLYITTDLHNYEVVSTGPHCLLVAWIAQLTEPFLSCLARR